METICNGFSADYVTELGKQYLVLTRTDFSRQDLITHQIEMIIRNPIPGFAPLEVREKDLLVKLYYPLQGYISLANFLRREKISKANFVDLVDKLLATIIDSKKYFLLEHSFIFAEDYLYVDPKSLDLRLVYVPVEFSKSVEKTASVRVFLLHLAIDIANIDTQDNFVQRFLQLVKQEEMALPELRRELHRLKGSAVNPFSNSPAVSTGSATSHTTNSPFDLTKAPNGPNTPDIANASNVPNTPNTTITPNVPNELNMSIEPKRSNSLKLCKAPVSDESKLSNNQTISNGPNISGTSSHNSPIVGGSKGNRLLSPNVGTGDRDQQVAFFGLTTRKAILSVLAVLSVGAAFLSTIEDLPDFLASNAEGLVYLLLAGVLAVGLILRNLSGKSTPQKEKQLQGRNKPSADSEYPINNGPSSTNPGQVNLFTFELDRQAAVKVPQVARVLTEVTPSDETEILAGGNYPLLKAAVGSETIIITKPEFNLGRNQEVCDYAVQNHGIGRLHAQVKQMDGAYYLTDLDSKNGTFVNGERLVSNKPLEIKHQDKIALANAEYYFWVKVEEESIC